MLSKPVSNACLALVGVAKAPFVVINKYLYPIPLANLIYSGNLLTKKDSPVAYKPRSLAPQS